jgi:hypothetical protein
MMAVVLAARAVKSTRPQAHVPLRQIAALFHDDIAAHIEAPRRVDVHTVKAMLT